jgi:hypothetical protein
MIKYLFHNDFVCTQEIKTKLNYPVSLCEVKRHLRIDNDFVDDDAYLEGLIIAATQLAENFIEKDIAETSTVLRLDDFVGDYVRITDGNFLSLTSVVNDASVAIGTVHQTSKHDNFFQIEWTTSLCSNPLTITYKTGFLENTTPPIIKQAILIKIADLYDSQRADYNWSGMQDNKVFENILTYYKQIRF